MKKAVIVMATYNGEKYIREQLESLINQSWKNISICIRDDGSTDNTLSIIEEYKEKLDKSNSGIEINIIDNGGKNLGYPECFYELLRKAKEADYYFLCDQDDVWNNKKVELMINRMEKEDSNKPLLCMSAFEYCNLELKHLKNSTKVTKDIEYMNVIYDLMEAFGFSLALNKELKNVILNHIPVTTGRKDWWILMTAAALGKVVYEDECLAKYRRHNEAVTFSNTTEGVLSKVGRRLKEFVVNDSNKVIVKSLKEFREVYDLELSDKDKKLLDTFTSNSFFSRFKKAFYPGRLRSSLKDEIAFRMLFLIKG